MKLGISFLLANFASANLAANVSAVNLEVMIYLLWSSFLFSMPVNAVVVAKLVILGISFLTSFI